MDEAAPYLLLVEDNPNDEKLTLLALRESRILNEVKVARDGAQALEVLRTAKTPPQVVLLDLKLPKVDGLDVLREIRANEATKRLPVVIFTSSSEQTDLIRSYNLGVNSYVQKPVAFEAFLEAVNKLGLYWMLLNKTPKSE